VIQPQKAEASSAHQAGSAIGGVKKKKILARRPGYATVQSEEAGANQNEKEAGTPVSAAQGLFLGLSPSMAALHPAAQSDIREQAAASSAFSFLTETPALAPSSTGSAPTTQLPTAHTATTSWVPTNREQQPMEQPAYITAEPSSGGSRVDIGLDVQGDGGGRKAEGVGESVTSMAHNAYGRDAGASESGQRARAVCE
jgi:hypothetical protein